jgi:hypothetical protein
VAIRAIEARREQKRPCSVSIVYTKADEAGVAEVGSPRLVGDTPGGRRALAALQAAPLGEAVARLQDFVRVATADPRGSAEWSRLRGELLVRTSVLWDVLARCPALPPRSLNGYVAAAKPVERDEANPTPWADRGVIHVFRDFFEQVRQRNAAPALAWWMLAAGACAALALAALAFNAQRRVASIVDFDEMNRRGPDRLEAKSTPSGEAPRDKWAEKGKQFVGPDDVAEATLLAALHQRYAGLAAKLRQISPRPAGDLAAARQRLADAAAARRDRLDRQKFWDDVLTARERAAADAQPLLKRLLDGMRDTQVLLEEADKVLAAGLATGDQLSDVTGRPVAERLERLRAIETTRGALLAHVARLREDPAGRAEFFAFSGTPPVGRPSTVAADILAPYSAMANGAIEQLRLEGKHVLDGVKGTDDYHAWHLTQTNEQVQFVKAIDPSANIDPLDRSFYAEAQTRHVQPLRPRRTMVILRLRDLQTQRTYDLDLSTGMHEVKDGRDGCADAAPVVELLGPQVGDGPRQSEAESLDTSRFEVLSVHVMPGQPPFAGGHRALSLEARGRKSGFWLPAFLDALGTPSLKIGGLTDEMKHEWEAFREQMK